MLEGEDRVLRHRRAREPAWRTPTDHVVVVVDIDATHGMNIIQFSGSSKVLCSTTLAIKKHI